MGTGFEGLGALKGTGFSPYKLGPEKKLGLQPQSELKA
jgi:hypothetical protein